MRSDRLLNTLLGRWSSAWRDAAASAIAAGIAWILAVWLLGHPHPVFAAISAIVCLAPGLPSHGKQAVGLMLGVATGILVGEAALLLPEGLLVPEGLSLLRLGLATFFAILAAASFGLTPVVAIQAGVSAVLVLALGPTSAGAVRLEDVAIGVVVGLVFSQVLLTPDPVRQIDAAADDLLLRLSKALNSCADALEERNVAKAEAALQSFSSAHDSLIALGAGIDAAHQATRWSLRGRLASRAVGEIAGRYDRSAIRLYASCLLFGEAFVNALRRNDGPLPAELAEFIRDAAARCAALAAGEPVVARAATPPSVAEGWRSVVGHLLSVSEILSDVEGLRRDPGSTP